MASQTGSIDLTASNSVKLAAEAGWQSDLDDYYTKSEIDVTVGGIESDVTEIVDGLTQSSHFTQTATGFSFTLDDALDDAAKTATDYVTDITGGGVMVHPSDDDDTGVQITSDVDILRDGYSVINVGTQGDTSGNTDAGVTIYDGLGNAASNVRAVFGETITLGGTSESHVVVSQDAITMLDANDNVFMDVRDNGLYQTRTYTLTASGYHSAVFPDPQPKLIKDSETDVTITVDGVPYEYGVDATFDKHSAGDVVTLYDVWFRDPVPAAGSTIVVTFRTESDKTYTLGNRTDGTTEGPYSFVEGYNNEASGYMSHAEGGECSSTDSYAHSEGGGCIASHLYAHAEGCSTTASERAAHSEGWGTTASGAQSHAQNHYTIAASSFQTALGRYNVADANSTYAVIVGNGNGDSSRSNALTVDWDGNVECGALWRTGTSGTTSGGTTTLPSSGTYLLVTGHNSTPALNGIWIARTNNNIAFRLAGGGNVTVTVSGTNVNVTTTAGTVNVYYQLCGA